MNSEKPKEQFVFTCESCRLERSFEKEDHRDSAKSQCTQPDCEKQICSTCRRVHNYKTVCKACKKKLMKTVGLGMFLPS